MEIVAYSTLALAAIAAVASIIAAVTITNLQAKARPPLSKTALEDHLIAEAKLAEMPHLTRDEIRFFTGVLVTLGYWD